MDNRFARYGRLPLNVAREGFGASDIYVLREAWSSGRFGGAKDMALHAYANLSEFLPSAVIDGGASVSALPLDLRPELLELQAPTRRGSLSLGRLVAEPEWRLQGVIVLHHGRIVVEAYPGMAPRDRHVWMSVAKTWGGLLAAQLEDAGRLDPAAMVCDVLPEFADTAWRYVSLRDVLDMSTGLDLEETPAGVNDPTTPISRFFRAEFGEPDDASVLRTHNEAIAGVARLEPPGVAARYSSVVTNLLGLVIERLSGRRIAAHMQDVWEAMGAERAATLCLSPQGQPALHGLFSSTLRDLARFGLLHTPSWRVTSNTVIVSQAYLARLWSTGRPDNYMKADLGPRITQAFGEQPHHNACQWDAVFDDGDMFKGGMNGQGLYVSPRRDVVVAWFGINRDGIPMHPVARRLAQACAS